MHTANSFLMDLAVHALEDAQWMQSQKRVMTKKLAAGIWEK